MLDKTKMINNIIKVATALLIGITLLVCVIKLISNAVNKNNRIQSNYEAVQLYELSAAIQSKLQEYDNYKNITFVEHRARVKLNNKWGFVDDDGNVAVSLIYDLVYDFNQGVAIVELNNWNFVNVLFGL